MARKKLSQEKLDYYEELIRKELEESMKYIENVSREQSVGARESSGDLSSYAYHQADQGSDTNLMEHTAKMMDSERKKIRLLNDAMRRIQDGVFGVCDMWRDHPRRSFGDHPLCHPVHRMQRKDGR